MIRCDGFGKFLKQGLFTLSISCFILLGGFFVNSYSLYEDMYVRQNGVIGVSPYSSAYDVVGLSKGGLLTQSLGIGKNLFYLKDGVYFAWVYHPSYGAVVPYISAHSGSVYVQGVPLKYAICDSFSGYHISDYTLQNCTVNDFSSSSLEGISNFLKSITLDDYFAFKSRFVHYSILDSVGFSYCMSSNSIGKSICFGISDDNHSNDIYPGYTTKGNYTGDLDYPTSRDEISRSILSSSPGQAGYGGGGNIDGGSSDVSNSQITGDVMYSICTKNNALNRYKRNGYSEKICYSSYFNNTDIFNGNGSVNAFALTGSDIKDVWSDTSEYLRNGNTGGSMGYSQWLHYWRNTYEVYKRNSDTYTNPFIGVPVSIFTLMGNIDIYGKPFTNESIIDYCNLLLYTSDLNSAYSGVYSSEICSQSALDVLADTVGVHAESGQVVQGSSRDGITNRPGMHTPPVGNGGSQNGSASGSGGDGNYLESYQDGLTFQNNTFNLLKGTFKFPQNTGSNGVLPSYIIITMLCLIFFRFISH